MESAMIPDESRCANSSRDVPKVASGGEKEKLCQRIEK
jgi:hypothetical protein